MTENTAPIPVGWSVVYFWRRKIKKGTLPDPFAVGEGS
jgi:hypothetical protein